jgi:hypothetical protein
VVQEKFDAFGPRARLQRPYQPCAGAAAWTGEPRAVGPDRMILTRRRVARAVCTDIIRSDILERDAIGHEKFIRGGAMIGERPHNGAVIVAVIRPAVGLDDGPVRQISEDEVRCIRDAVFALRARAAAQGHVATAQNGMSADIVVRFHHDHGGPRLSGRKSGGEPCGPRTDHYDIGCQVPAIRHGPSARS